MFKTSSLASQIGAGFLSFAISAVCIVFAAAPFHLG